MKKLEREAAVKYLLERTDGKRCSSGEDDELAKRLAELLDGLPLALEQAGAHIAAQGLSFGQYLEAWERDRPAVLKWFDQLQVPGYPASVAVTWQRTYEQLAPAARALLRLPAHLAADPIPVEMVESGAELLEEAVELLGDEAEPAAGRATPTEALAELRKYSLMTWRGSEVSVHRMVQEVVRARIPEERRREWVEKAVRLVNDFAPGTPSDVRTWPVWDPLRPHASRVIELADRAEVREPTSTLMSQLGLLLNTKCVFSDAEPLMRRALEISEAAFGPDHPEVAIDLNNLAQLLQETNRLADAEPLMRRALEIMKRSYGEDYPDTRWVQSTLEGLKQS